MIKRRLHTCCSISGYARTMSIDSLPQFLVCLGCRPKTAGTKERTSCGIHNQAATSVRDHFNKLGHEMRSQTWKKAAMIQHLDKSGRRSGSSIFQTCLRTHARTSTRVFHSSHCNPPPPPPPHITLLSLPSKLI